MYLKRSLKHSFVLTAILVVNATFTQSAAAADPKLMVVGDSISAGFEQPSYRRALYRSLQAQDCSVDMVGDQQLTSFGFNRPAVNPGIDYPTLIGFTPPYPSGAHWSKDNPDDDTDHQAFGGIRADQIVAGAVSGATVKPIKDYIEDEQPDYVLLHAGTNDLSRALDSGEVAVEGDIADWAEKTADDMIDIIDAIFDGHDNPSDVKIIVGNFIPRGGETVQPLIDLESAMNEAYREELTQRIEDLDDARVVLADVATGFDNDDMTTDGIHPNAVGEQHIAGAFEFALADMGLCDIDFGPTVDYTLAPDTWSLLSVPATAPSGSSTIQALFGDDIPNEDYGFNWTVRLYNSATDSYDDPGEDGVLSPGQAFWIIQVTNAAVTLDMPSGSTPTAANSSTGCTASDGCFSQSLDADSAGILWNAVGNPFYTSPSVDSIRVTTNSGVCANSGGCTLAEAADETVANVLFDEFFWYDGNDYQPIGSGDSLTPWRGYYAAVLTGADGVAAKLQIPRN